MELWDAYNENGELIKGVTLVRGKKVPDGLFHLVCEIIVRHADGEYLLMQRDPAKHFGGMWEASAGGSVIQGEDALTGAKRELFEETGIKAERLKDLGRVVMPGDGAIYAEFLCETDLPKDSIVLQKGETAAYRWVTKDELMNMKTTELVTSRIQNFIDELWPAKLRQNGQGGNMTDYRLISEQVRALAEESRDPIPVMANVAALLYDSMADVNWAGFYLVRGEYLLLGPFQGKVACVKIYKGKGVCGTAWKEDRTQLVPDVHLFPGHIACDSASRSEIVVPIHAGGEVVGVLDIDSPRLARFTRADEAGLTELVKTIEQIIS